MGPSHSSERRRLQRRSRQQQEPEAESHTDMSHDTLVEGPSTPATGVSRHSTAEREPPGMGIDTPTLANALSHVSHRLLQKTKEHHTFIVTGDVLFSLFFRSKRTTRAVELLQTSTLSLKQKEALVSGVLKTTEKYGIGRDDWLNNAGEVAMLRLNMHGGDVEEVVARSLVQKEIVFSGDGMTLVAVDFVYELRKMLHLLSRELEGGDGSGSEEMGGVYIDDMVELMRRLVTVEGRGRSLRKEVVEERYKTLVFSNGAWAVIAEEYERRFGEKGLREDGDEVGDRS